MIYPDIQPCYSNLTSDIDTIGSGTFIQGRYEQLWRKMNLNLLQGSLNLWQGGLDLQQGSLDLQQDTLDLWQGSLDYWQVWKINNTKVNALSKEDISGKKLGGQTL